MGSEARSAVAVSSWGKWKTATQMGSLTMLLLCRSPAGSAPAPLLVLATWLTVHSLGLYLRALWPYLSRP
jgi:CDP-diacylglycerol--glycerol-3-phosphate 3-phosphatidyltransferase